MLATNPSLHYLIPTKLSSSSIIYHLKHLYITALFLSKKKNITALLQGLELRSLTHLSLFCYCFAACRFQTPKDITNLHIFISGIKYSNPRSNLVVNQT